MCIFELDHDAKKWQEPRLVSPLNYSGRFL
jgi:hypothetical protein